MIRKIYDENPDYHEKYADFDYAERKLKRYIIHIKDKYNIDLNNE